MNIKFFSGHEETMKTLAAQIVGATEKCLHKRFRGFPLICAAVSEESVDDDHDAVVLRSLGIHSTLLLEV
jgi:hypothetical protein